MTQHADYCRCKECLLIKLGSSFPSEPIIYSGSTGTGKSEASRMLRDWASSNGYAILYDSKPTPAVPPRLRRTPPLKGQHRMTETDTAPSFAEARSAVIRARLLEVASRANATEELSDLALRRIVDQLAEELDSIEPLRDGAKGTELVAAGTGQPYSPMRQIRNTDGKANVIVEVSVIRLGREYLGRGRINGYEFDCNPKETQLAAAQDVGQQLCNPANQQARIALALALNSDVAEDASASGGFF